MDLLNKLFENQDKEYASFQAKLMPGIKEENVIGVRLPIARKIAKEYLKDEESKTFLKTLPHKYYDENIVHGMLISEIKDYDTCIEEIERFLPYVDNWAVCDTMIPKVLKKNKQDLLKKIKKWSKSKETYTCRFGIKMLMSFYLDEDFKEEYLEIPASVHSDEYYIQMMIAWFYATALAKKWDETIKYLENNKLDTWVHNKTIQKARESFRITDKQKEYLNTLKRK